MSDRWKIALFLAVSTALVYANVVGFEFLDFDDNKYLNEHNRVRQGLTWRNVEWAFTTEYFSNWHPLTWLSYFVDREIFGMEPGGFHLTNLLLHIVNTLLVFRLLDVLTGCPRRSAFVAGLFALHPMHVESVAWVSERKDLLSTGFALACTWAYAAYARRGGALRYLAVALLLAASLLSKAMFVTWPFALLLLDVWPLGRFRWAPGASAGAVSSDARRDSWVLLVEKLPLLALCVGTGALALWSQDLGGSVVPVELIGLPERIGNAVVSYRDYVWKTVWPVAMSMAYQHPYMAGGSGISVSAVASSVAVLASVSAGAAWGWRTGYLPVGWLWFLGILVPVIGIVQVGHAGMADRYTYVAYLGPFVAAVWGIADVLDRWVRSQRVRDGVRLAALALLLPMTFQTWLQVQVWRSDTTLMHHALRFNQGNYVIYSALGREYYQRHEFESALRIHRIARRLAPAKADIRHQVGLALEQLGELPAAIRQWEFAVSLDPNDPKPFKKLGRALIGSGESARGIEILTAAVELSPNDPRLRLDLARELIRSDRGAEAVGHLESSSRKAPGWAQPLDELAWLLATSPDAALRDGERALALASRADAMAGRRRPEVMGTLAAAHAELGEFDIAREVAIRALELARDAGVVAWERDLAAALALYEQGLPVRAHRPRLPETWRPGPS